MKNLIVISGPTASGKSKLAEIIAEECEATIINADSLQVYKELPILTSQPRKQNDRYKLYSILNHQEHCSVSIWCSMAVNTIAETLKENKRAIVVGGTGLYIKALLYGMSEMPKISSDIREEVRVLFHNIGNKRFFELLIAKDPTVRRKINIGDSQRMMRAMEVFLQTSKSITHFQQSKNSSRRYQDYHHISLLPERHFLYSNCNSRFLDMIEDGAMEEVKTYKEKISSTDTIAKAIGFKEISQYLDSDISMDEAISRASQLTRNYAKRQITWFKNQMYCKQVIEYGSRREFDTQINKILCSF